MLFLNASSSNGLVSMVNSLKAVLIENKYFETLLFIKFAVVK